MIVILISVLAATAATPNPRTSFQANSFLFDNSCRHSVEKAGFPTSPTLYNRGHAPLLYKLSDLPDADEEILVNRTVNGCPVPLVVMSNVSSRPR